MSITQSINKFILPSGHLNPDLSDKEVIKLNETASQLACKPLLDQPIDYHIQSLQDICLDKSEVKHEVEEIRKTLKKDEKIGYIFTNNTDKTKEHIECLILTKKISLNLLLGIIFLILVFHINLNFSSLIFWEFHFLCQTYHFLLIKIIQIHPQHYLTPKRIRLLVEACVYLCYINY